MNDGRKFVLKKMTKFNDFEQGLNPELPASDLCLTTNDMIIQFDYIEEQPKKMLVSPGIYTVTHSPALSLQPTELRNDPLLSTIDNTSKIKNEINIFFSKLQVYEELNQPKSRKILLYSDPGLGKSAAINKSVHDLIKDDPGTVVIVWPTDEVNSSEIKNLLSLYIDYKESCTNLVIIMEDIGGGQAEYAPNRNVDSSLLTFLDGVNVSFKIPTFIIATTNYPQNLLSALADRPGRFDQLIELKTPSSKERVDLVAFIAKRALTDDEITAISSKDAETLSIAHLKEIVIRSRLHDKTIGQVVKEMRDHTEKFKSSFNKDGRKLGISSSWDD